MYTIVFTFRGTPVVRQVVAGTPDDALAVWARKGLPANKTPAGSLLDAVSRENLVPVRGLKNVWTVMLSFGFNEFGQQETGVVVITATQIDNMYGDVITEIPVDR